MIYLSQRDLQWAKEKIGLSQLTIGRWGCCLTTISMLSSYFNCYVSPSDLAHNVHNFTPEGLILWKNLMFGHMKFDERVYTRNDSEIQRALKDPNRAVILQVNGGQHWVVALRKALIGDDYLCADPWTGKKCWALKTYHNITGEAFFSRV